MQSTGILAGNTAQLLAARAAVWHFVGLHQGITYPVMRGLLFR